MKKILLTVLAVLAMTGMAVAQTAPSDINLHRNDDGTWSFIMPGRNLVMSTETFSTNDTVNGHYLAGVPEGWLILALGDTVPVSNDSLRRTTPITEGTPVTIVPTGNLRRIKSITLVDEFTPVESITLNKTETSIKVDSTETLSVTAVAPDNATDKTYTWKTSDETKATVDQDGKVTAVAEGTVTIYAEANDGSGVKGNCTVTVTPATPEYYNKLTNINDNFSDQVYLLKQLGRGRQAYNSSLTAAQAYALATYQAAIDGIAVYVIMSSQDDGYEIHYAVSTDASATEHTAALYDLCSKSNTVRMYYVAQ